MKKLVMTLMLVSAGFAAFSQAEVALGIKGGMNLASVSGSTLNGDFSTKTGYHFGAYGMVKVLSFGLQPEILYSTAGSKIEASSVTSDLSQDLVYLQVPVLVKFYLPLGINFYAGPQFGQLMSAKGEVDTGTGTTAKITKNSYKDSDKSLIAGAGIDLPFGLAASARYILGLTDTSIANDDNKNRMFQLSIGYSFVNIGR